MGCGKTIFIWQLLPSIPPHRAFGLYEKALSRMMRHLKA